MSFLLLLHYSDAHRWQFRMLSKPCSVIRDITLKAIDMLDAASIKPSRDTRVVFSACFLPFPYFILTYVPPAGERGAGKSFALLQAIQYAIARHWIVLYIPRGLSPFPSLAITH